MYQTKIERDEAMRQTAGRRREMVIVKYKTTIAAALFLKVVNFPRLPH
jgi:hypothetical protein